MKTEKKEAKEGLSFRGYASEEAFRSGMVVDEGYRLVTGSVQTYQMCKHRCEVVFLPDDFPEDAPPVGSVVGRKGSSDHYQVLTTSFTIKGGAWFVDGAWGVVVKNKRTGVTFMTDLSTLTRLEQEFQEFTITLKGTEQDAEHLKRIMKDHELEVVVEPVS